MIRVLLAGLLCGLLFTGAWMLFQRDSLGFTVGVTLAVGLPVGLWIRVHPVAGLAALAVVAETVYESYDAGLLDKRIVQGREVWRRARVDLWRAEERLREVIEGWT